MRKALLLLLFCQLALAQLEPQWSYSPGGMALAAAVQSDGLAAAAGFDSGKAALLGADGSPIWEKDYGERVTAALVSADGSRIAFAHGRTLSLLDAQGNELWSAGIGEAAVSAAMTRDGGAVAVSTSRAVMLFSNGTLLWNHSTVGQVNSVAISSQRSIFGGLPDGYVQRWELDGSPAERLSMGGVINAVAVSSDGAIVAAGGEGRRVYLAGRDGVLKWKLDTHDEISALALSPDADYAVAGTTAGDVYLVEKDGEVVLQHDVKERVERAAVSDDGGRFAVAHGGSVDLFDVEKHLEGRLVAILALLNRSVESGADLSFAEELYAGANSAMLGKDYASAMRFAKAAENATATAVAQARAQGERQITLADEALAATRAEGLGFLVGGQLAAAQERASNARRLNGEGKYGAAADEARGAANDAVAAGNTAKIYLVAGLGVLGLLFLLVIAWRTPAVIEMLSPSHLTFMVEQAMILRDAGHIRMKADALGKHLASGRDLGIDVSQDEAQLKSALEALAEGERLANAKKLAEGQERVRHAKKEIDALLIDFKAKLEARKREHEKEDHEVLERAEEFIKKKQEGQGSPEQKL